MIQPPRAHFLAPMECERVSKLPEGGRWTYEVKWDGYRALAIKSGGLLDVVSRRNRPLELLSPALTETLERLDEGTVLDGELVALDEEGRPSFNRLQNHRKGVEVHFFAFDILFHKHESLIVRTLLERRRLLRSVVEPLGALVRYSEAFDQPGEEVVHAFRGHGLEGVVAKSADSLYEPGKRSGAWMKLRLNQGQESRDRWFHSGSSRPRFADSWLLQGSDLVYVARVRAGLNPFIKTRLTERLKPLLTEQCPFANLPEAGSHRWGERLTAKKMGSAFGCSLNL